MLTVVTWLWSPEPGYRSKFDAEKANVLFRMVDRHYPLPHRNVCVTDMPDGLDPSVTVVEAWNDHAYLPSPHGGLNPSCYRRLRAFDPGIGEVFGPRFVSLDLDVVIAGDLRPVFDRPEDFVIYGDPNPRTAYNGSMFLLTAGARPDVWERFDPRQWPAQARSSGQYGSDQGWIGYCLGPNEATWTSRDGVYSFRVELAGKRVLPEPARVVVFHGRQDPWSSSVQANYPWVREHWC
jgi:hypothetical protein